MTHTHTSYSRVTINADYCDSAGGLKGWVETKRIKEKQKRRQGVKWGVWKVVSSRKKAKTCELEVLKMITEKRSPATERTEWLETVETNVFQTAANQLGSGDRKMGRDKRQEAMVSVNKCKKECLQPNGPQLAVLCNLSSLTSSAGQQYLAWWDLIQLCSKLPLGRRAEL